MTVGMEKNLGIVGWADVELGELRGRYEPFLKRIRVPSYTPISPTETTLQVLVDGRDYGLVRRTILDDGGRRYEPLWPFGGYYEPITTTPFSTFLGAMVVLAESNGDMELSCHLDDYVASVLDVRRRVAECMKENVELLLEGEYVG